MARRATALVLTDVPIGAWTVAITFDVLDLIRSRREFALAADTSIAIGLVCAAGTAATRAHSTRLKIEMNARTNC
jgi:hypothetical protein